MPISVLPQFDPNFLQKRLALEAAVLNSQQNAQAQAIQNQYAPQRYENDLLNQALQRQLVPLQIQQHQIALDAARQKFNEYQNPGNQALRQASIEQDLFNAGVIPAAPRIQGQPAALPALPLTTDQQALINLPEAQGNEFTAESINALAPQAPRVLPGGAVYDPAFRQQNINDAIIRQISQKGREADVVAAAKAKYGAEKTYVNTEDPTDVRTFRPNEDVPNNFIPIQKPTAAKETAITGNEIAKALNEGNLVGVPYDLAQHGDLKNPTNYANYKKAINDADEAQGAISDPRLKQLAVRAQQNFNKEIIVTTKKNLEIFGKEATDAINHIITHPNEPAGARQIEAFDSFIKAFSAGKPTVAQYGKIEQYQSAEDYFTNLFARLTAGRRLNDNELKTYSDALQDASKSIDSAYRVKVKQYRDELQGYGVKSEAAKKVIKSENIDEGASNVFTGTTLQEAEAKAEKANLMDGTPVILNGRPAIFRKSK